MVSTSKRKDQNKKLLGQLDESLNDFVIESKIGASVLEEETVPAQNNGLFNKST